MKIKAIPQNIYSQKRFFLLMIVPLLIGLMISLTNFAHAEWETQNLNNPKNQGWTQIQTHQASSDLQKGEAKS